MSGIPPEATHRPTHRVESNHSLTSESGGLTPTTPPSPTEARASSRGMRGRAVRLLRRLSERDIELLRTLDDLRLANTAQLQRLHQPQGSGRTPLRRTQAMLRRLLDHGLVVRLGRQVGGIRAGSRGYIFGLSGLGQAVLDLSETRQSRRRRRVVWAGKPYFQDHILAVSETYVQLVEACRTVDAELLAFEAEPACWRRFAGAGGQTMTLKPDAFTRVGIGDYEQSAFLEVDLGTESLPTIKRKCQTYIDYWRSGVEQQRHGVFPRVIWLVPDERRVDGIASVLQQFVPEAGGRLFTVALSPHGAAILTTLPTQPAARGEA